MVDKYAKKAKAAQIIRNCRNKKSYDTESEALEKGSKFWKFKLRAYRCPVCEKYHLTKQEGR